MKILRSLPLVLILASLATPAATPPAQVNYQGVLRSASDAPLTGTYDMVFSFWDAATAGNEILDDAHTGASGSAVSVSGGLFNVALGSGAVTDGPGPGTYTALDQVFRDYASVWLQVKVGTETLSPRTRVSAAPYALNATALAGLPPSNFLDTSSTAQAKSGPVTLTSTAPGSVALTANADGVAAQFKSPRTNSSASLAGDYAGYFDAPNGIGLVAKGSSEAALFQPSAGGGDAVGILDGQAAVHAVAFNTVPAVWAYGTYGVYAESPNTGVVAFAAQKGGDFYNTTDTSEAYLAWQNVGVEGYGYLMGGYFMDRDSGAYADLGYSAYIVAGNGTKAFRQNHPYDRNRVIVYNALEGNEAGTYTRGSAQLVNGVARVALDPTFAWTTNPDLGLTATATARGTEPVALSVSALGTKELVVHGPAGSNASFDYVVHGLRLGFEELPIVQPKDHEAPIPSLASLTDQVRLQPDLRGFTALDRFQRMQAGGKAVDRSASAALVASINAQTNGPVAPHAVERSSPLPATPAGPVAARPVAAGPVAAGPIAAGPIAAGPAPAAPLGVALVSVAERVQPGDVVAADPALRGALRPVAQAADPLVAGIVAPAAPAAAVDDGHALLAVAGSIVPCRVDATLGAIHAGDLLTGAPTPGHAMKAGAATAGTIVGKALENLEAGTGLINVLVMSR